MIQTSQTSQAVQTIQAQVLGISRQLHFMISPTKTFNQPSVSSAMGDEPAHDMSGLSSLCGNIQTVMSYQQIDTPQSYRPTNQQQHTTSPPTTQQQEPPQHVQ